MSFFLFFRNKVFNLQTFYIYRKIIKEICQEEEPEVIRYFLIKNLPKLHKLSSHQALIYGQMISK